MEIKEKLLRLGLLSFIMYSEACKNQRSEVQLVEFLKKTNGVQYTDTAPRYKMRAISSTASGNRTRIFDLGGAITK